MLHPLAQDVVFRLTADFDRQTLLDFYVAFHRRVRELDDLARRERRRSCSQDDIDRLDAPLIVGGTVLRRPSAAAMQWLAECASKWWGKHRRAWTFALAYACANREQAAYDGLFSRVRASAICWSFCLRIRASEEALRRAAISLLPPPDDSLEWFDEPDIERETDEAYDLGAISLALSKQFGGTPAHWLWETAEEDFWKAVYDLADEADQTKDPKHEDPNGWWRRHRRALVACEKSIGLELAAWLKSRETETEERHGQ